MRTAIRALLVAAGLAALAPLAAHAEIGDPGTAALVDLFNAACLPNKGRPDNVRAWASRQKLPAITDPNALSVVVGVGSKGSAWAVDTVAGQFALSIRGTTQACAVWARQADPAAVETAFIGIVDGEKKPGLQIETDADRMGVGPQGKTHAVAFRIYAPGAATGFEYTMLTTERPGGPFQASLQVARASVPQR